MAKISISMTDNMEANVHQRVKDGDFNNVSEYFRDLVRRDVEMKQKYEALKQAIQDGINSGISERTATEVFADTRNRLLNDVRLHAKR